MGLLQSHYQVGLYGYLWLHNENRRVRSATSQTRKPSCR